MTYSPRPRSIIRSMDTITLNSWQQMDQIDCDDGPQNDPDTPLIVTFVSTGKGLSKVRRDVVLDRSRFTALTAVDNP